MPIKTKAKLAFNYVLTAYYNKKKEEVLQLGENLLLNPSMEEMKAFYLAFINVVEKLNLRLRLSSNHSKVKSINCRLFFSLGYLLLFSLVQEEQTSLGEASFMLTHSAYVFFDNLKPELI